MLHTTLYSYRLSPFSISNTLQLASFDDEYCTLGEESKSCASEVFNPVDCTDVSTSQLTTSSMPITVLLEDTVYRLFSENTVVFEDCQQTVSHHTEVHTLSCIYKCPVYSNDYYYIICMYLLYIHRILRILRISSNSLAV